MFPIGVPFRQRIRDAKRVFVTANVPTLVLYLLSHTQETSTDCFCFLLKKTSSGEISDSGAVFRSAVESLLIATNHRPFTGDCEDTSEKTRLDYP